MTTRIRSRRFGDDAGGREWTLDDVAAHGLNTVPGGVLDIFADGDGTDFDLEAVQVDAAALLAMRGEAEEADPAASAVLEWASVPSVFGVPSRMRLVDASLPEAPDTAQSTRRLHELKHSLQCLAEILVPSAVGSLASIDREAISSAGVERDRELPAPVLRAVVEQYVRQLTLSLGQPFPLTIGGQVLEIAQHLLSRSIASSQQSDHTLTISMCLSREFGDGDETASSGFLFNRLAAPSVALPRGVCSRSGLRALRAGTTETGPLEDLTLSDPEELRRVCDYLDTNWRSPTRASFVVVDGRLLIAAVERTRPRPECIAGLVEVDEPAGALFAAASTWVRPQLVDRLMTPTLSAEESRSLVPIGAGLGVGGGVCSGRLLLATGDRTSGDTRGPRVLMATTPVPELMSAILDSAGLLFTSGGSTSHVAVIARGSGKPCVMAVRGATVDTAMGVARFGEHELRDGDWITVDGTTGRIYQGRATVRGASLMDTPALERLLSLAATLGGPSVYANADTGDEAAAAFAVGAAGIGLCRIEHLLARPQTLQALQEVIAVALLRQSALEKYRRARLASLIWPGSRGAAGDLQECEQHLAQDRLIRIYLERVGEIESALKAELTSIVAVAGGRPVFVRLLDPPVLEFLSPRTIRELPLNEFLSDDEVEELLLLVADESVMGTRGVRLSVLAPHLEAAQLRAVTGLAVADQGTDSSQIGLLLPFVVSQKEVAEAKLLLQAEAGATTADSGSAVQLGSMIETPRAALMAGAIAQTCDFLSIGSNDLTQFTWALSRDANGASTARWRTSNPFSALDIEGVGELIRSTVVRARKANPAIRIGVCGEHAALPDAVRFFTGLGVDYLSCSPLSVPTTRLAVAFARANGQVPSREGGDDEVGRDQLPGS